MPTVGNKSCVVPSGTNGTKGVVLILDPNIKKRIECKKNIAFPVLLTNWRIVINIEGLKFSLTVIYINKPVSVYQ